MEIKLTLDGAITRLYEQVLEPKKKNYCAQTFRAKLHKITFSFLKYYDEKMHKAVLLGMLH